MPGNPSSRLWQPLKFGRHQLQRRVALAPLTRFRADDDHVPLPFVADYYAQRGAEPGTLLISEASYISPQAVGYFNAPGLWNDTQLASWKRVTDAVHAKDSFIYAQLWAMGRAAEAGPAAKHGVDIVSSSDVALPDHTKPRPLTEEEIQQLIKDYAQAAKNAVEKGGFDGVEIHGANGYLPDQFLQDTSNKRTDRWGGSVENRARFHIEVAKAIVAAIGADRVGIRLSPWSSFQGMRMADPRPTYIYLVQELKKLKLAFLHLVEPRIEEPSPEHAGQDISNTFILDLWDNQSPILLAGGLDDINGYETADKQYPNRDVVAVYGRSYIATPDLPYRLRKGIPFTPYDRSTFYMPKVEAGYIDYPFSDEFKAEHANL